jgi:hypothetical protein
MYLATCFSDAMRGVHEERPERILSQIMSRLRRVPAAF